MKLTTNTIENAEKNKKKKWRRHDAKAILTPVEKRKLKDNTWRSDRHLRYKVKLKTWKALVEDLPLILNTLRPEDFLNEARSCGVQTAIPPTQKFIKNLLIYYYKLEEYRIMDERAKEKRKLKVAFKEAWNPVNKIIREAKKELQEMDESNTTLKTSTLKG